MLCYKSISSVFLYIAIASRFFFVHAFCSTNACGQWPQFISIIRQLNDKSSMNLHLTSLRLRCLKSYVLWFSDFIDLFFFCIVASQAYLSLNFHVDFAEQWAYRMEGYKHAEKDRQTETGKICTLFFAAATYCSNMCVCVCWEILSPFYFCKNTDKISCKAQPIIYSLYVY